MQGYYYTYMFLILVRLSLCFCLRAFSVLFAPLAELCSILNFLKIIFIFLVVNQCSFLLLIHPIVDQPLHAEFNRELKFCEFFLKIRGFSYKNWKIFFLLKNKKIRPWVAKILGLENQSLWQRLNSFQSRSFS